ncbi:MAG: hypothetical protein Q8L48_24920 [Archangium sp.]|nr:hypothetical protein [Archangium sp.]
MTMTFEGATKSSRYTELMEHQPSVAGHMFWGVVGITFCLAATLGCLYGALVLDKNGPLIAGVAAGVMGVVSVFAIRSHHRFMSAPLERRLAQVKDETVETHVTTSTTHQRKTNVRHTSTRTSHSYHLLLEFEDGERESHEVDEDTARLTATGDIGFAYLKGGVLLDFKPV